MQATKAAFLAATAAYRILWDICTLSPHLHKFDGQKPSSHIPQKGTVPSASLSLSLISLKRLRFCLFLPHPHLGRIFSWKDTSWVLPENRENVKKVQSEMAPSVLGLGGGSGGLVLIVEPQQHDVLFLGATLAPVGWGCTAPGQSLKS